MEDAGVFGSVVGNGDFVGMTYALKTIGAFAKEGWSNVLPELQALINGVVRLSLIMTFMVWLFKPSPDSIAEFLWVVIKLNFVLWIMNNFWDITQKIFDGMIGMGLAAAPDAVKGLADTEAMKDPGRVANLGTIAVTPLIKHIDSMLGPADIFWYATELLFAYAALITAISVFLVFGLLIFLATVEFYIVAIPAGCMAPFIAWNKSAFIATPAIAYVFNSGIRLLGTTIVVMMGLSIMLAYTWPTEPTIQDSINILILTIAIFGAALSVFKKLSGLINGGPVSDVGGALGAMWYAARLGSAAGKEISEVGAGLSSGRGPLPKALTGFVNGVRGAPGPGGVPGTPGAAANANGPGGLRGAFQRGIAGARANVAAGAAAGGGQSSSWYQQPTAAQMGLAASAGVPLSGLNRAQATVALSRAGFGGPLNTGSAAGIAAAGTYGTQTTSRRSSASAGQTQTRQSTQTQSRPHQGAAASAGATGQPAGSGTSQSPPQPPPGASSGFLGAYKQDMRGLQAHYDAMARDPAVGPAVADSLRRDAYRDKAIDTAQAAEITDPVKAQGMFDQIDRIDNRVQRAIAAGRPADVINQKSSADYRDVVLNS